MPFRSSIQPTALLAAALLAISLRADPLHNPPLVCTASQQCSACPTPDGPSSGCILVSLDLGVTTPWSSRRPVSLRIHSSAESESLSTPSHLKVVLGHSFKHIGGGLTAAGAPESVTLVQPEGTEQVFHFRDGESVGVPEPNLLGKSDARLLMVDAEGWATLSAPAYYDLHPGDGSVWRFLATGATNERGALVSFTDPRGRALTPADFGVDIVRDALGNVRQVKTPSRLADVVAESPTRYVVTVYPLAADPDFDAAAGLYAVPSGVTPVRVLDMERGATVRELLVGFRKGSGPRRLYRYEAVNGDWTLRRPDGLSDAQEVYYTPDEDGAQRLHVIRDAAGTPLSRTECNYVLAYWGYLMTNRVDGLPGEARRSQSWSYYGSGAHRDLLRETVTPTGERIQYEYDDQNRIVRETRPLSGEVSTYSYAPVDPDDPPLLRDMRPRLVVRTMQGVEVERTYYAYTTNRTEIVERCATPGALYGAPDSLRTVRTWNDPAAPGPEAGLPASAWHEDGTLDLFDYVLDAGLWTETATHVHEAEPAPVPMRTTRDVAVYDARSRLVERRTELLTAPDEWTAIDRVAYTYDAEGNEIRREDLAGRVWTSVWGGACCGKTSETDWQGVTTLYAYDEEGRIAQTLQESVRTELLYDALGRLTNVVRYGASGGNSPEMSAHPSAFRYDSMGHILWNEGEDGIAKVSTRALLPGGGAVETVIEAPGTNCARTNTTEYLPDGRLARELRNGIPIRTVVYSPLSTTAYRGSKGEDSPVWERTERDMLGRPVRVLRPGFGGATLFTESTYGEYGRVDSTRTGHFQAATPNNTVVTDTEIFTYDAWGSRVLSARDANQNGVIDLSGPDVVVSNAIGFLSIDGVIWRSGEVFTFPDSGSAEPFLSSRELSRFTGLGVETEAEGIGAATVVSESVSIDSFGAATTNRVLVRRGNAAVLRQRLQPDSIQAAWTLSLGDLEVTNRTATGVLTSFLYDSLNRPLARIDGRGNATTVAYDDFNRIVYMEEATGARTNYGYDALGRQVSVENPLGLVVTKAFDAADHVLSERGATYPVDYEYDEYGHRTALFTYRTEDLAHGDRTTWLLDEATGLVTNKVYADGLGSSYGYTPDGRLARRIWARGVITDYAYDAFGNLVAVDYSDDTPDVAYVRDRLGNVLSAICEGVSTNLYAYNRAGQVTNEWQNGASLTRDYDGLGREAGYWIDGAESNRVAYAYDGFGRFSAVDFSTNRAEYIRVSGSDLIAGYSIGEFRRSVSYEPHRDLIATVTNTFGANLVSAFDYESDAAGRRVSRLDWYDGSVTTNLFGYNGRSELTSAQMGTNSFSYAYDPIGNRTETQENTAHTMYSANELNQYTLISSNGVSRYPTYDADGNMTSNGEEWTYIWNGENRMVMASNGAIVVTFAYDERGRMIRKDTDFKNAVPETKLQWWDGYNVARELRITNAETNASMNVWGVDMSETLQGAGGIGGLLFVVTSSIFAMPAYDGNGNVHVYISQTGSILSDCSYDSYGMTTSRNGPFYAGYGFSTKQSNELPCMISYENRDYYTEIGRWISRDWLSESSSPNLYLYASNDSINHVDILGLFSPPKPQKDGKKCETKGKCGIYSCSLVGSNNGVLHGGEKEYYAHQQAKIDEDYRQQYFNVLEPRYYDDWVDWQRKVIDWYGSVEAWKENGGYPMEPVKPRPPKVPDPNAYNPYLCFPNEPQCDESDGWKPEGKAIFWNKDGKFPFPGKILGKAPSTCGKDNCFQIESRYMTTVFTMPFAAFRTYTPPDINDFHYSRWCCKCVVDEAL